MWREPDPRGQAPAASRGGGGPDSFAAMDDTGALPVYFVSTGSLDAALRRAFPHAAAYSWPEELFPLEDRRPGLVLVGRDDAPSDDILQLVEAAAAAEGPWMVVLVRGKEAGVEAVPFSLGWPTPLEALATWAAEGGVGAVLELRAVLKRISRARHDINNPLTSGLAETQLLLMDAPPKGEMREALDTIQTQLRRIRDMVADLRELRPPG